MIVAFGLGHVVAIAGVCLHASLPCGIWVVLVHVLDRGWNFQIFGGFPLKQIRKSADFFSLSAELNKTETVSENCQSPIKLNSQSVRVTILIRFDSLFALAC